MDTKWTMRWINRAIELSRWSKDPNKKVGCVAIDDEYAEVAGGYNGFPRRIADDNRLLNRDLKLRMVIHAEENMLCNAARLGHSTKGATAFISEPPCSHCAGMLINAGIKGVVYRTFERGSSWADDYALALVLLHEAGIAVEEVRRDGSN